MARLTPAQEDQRQALRQRVAIDHTYHPPSGSQAQRYEMIRRLAREYAEAIIELCPPSRELSTALTKIEESVFHANASIARTGYGADETPEG